MRRYFRYGAGTLAIVLAIGLTACDGNGGSEAISTLPEVDRALGNFDPADPAASQTLVAQLATGSGVWEIALDGAVQVDLGGATPAIADALRYDANQDELWIQVDANWYLLPDAFDAGDSQSTGCPSGSSALCVEYLAIQTGEYAELSWFGLVDPATDSNTYVHFGVKTAAADMPTDGLATYEGESEYRPAVDGSFDGFVFGTPEITVVFDSGGGNLTYADVATDGADRLLTVGGDATFTGNSYTGSISGLYDPDTGTVDNELVLDSGTFSGTFYGPAADSALLSETAGVVSMSDTDGATSSTGTVIGGFWASQQTFTP